MIRVAFLVNNDGVGDTRVVKTAEVMASAGYDCTVYGCSRTIQSNKVIMRNSVRYEVTPLSRSFSIGLLVGILPRTYATITRFLKTTDQPNPEPDPFARQPSNYGNESTAADPKSKQIVFSRTAAELRNFTVKALAQEGKIHGESLQVELSFLKRAAKPMIRTVRFFYSAGRAFRRTLTARLHPRRSSLGVKSLFGLYLKTFYPRVVGKQFDIIYCHELWMLETGVLANISPDQTTIVYDSHELETHRHNDWLPGANRTRTNYEEKYVTRVDFVVTVCRSIAVFLRDAYGIDEPFVVPNAPLSSANRSVPKDRRLKTSLGLQNTKLIVYTGKVTTGRGLDLIVSALAGLDDVHLAIVGPRVTAVTNSTIQLASSHGIDARIHFVDPVAAELLVSLISDADLAVVPIENVCLSYYYSLPNKIYEAAMAGLPILASDFPELRRFVNEQGVGRTVDFADPSAVRADIRLLLAEGAVYNNHARAKAFRRQLSFDRGLQNLIDTLAKQASSI